MPPAWRVAELLPLARGSCRTLRSRPSRPWMTSRTPATWPAIEPSRGGDEAQFWNEGRDFAAHEECCGHAVPSGKMSLKNVVRLLPKPRGSRLWRGLLWVRGGGGKSPDHVKYTAYESQHLIPRLPASARSALWKLLAAANAPAIIAILAEHLYEADHGMRASEFYARVDRSLEELRATGVDMPSTAREYASQWLARGASNARCPTAATRRSIRSPRPRSTP